MNRKKILVTVVILAAIVVAIASIRGRWDWLLAAAEWAESAPELAWPLYMVSFVLVIILMLPGWLMMVVGGYLFGMTIGGLLAFAANLAGSIIAFFLAKTYARHWVERKLSDSPRFQGFDAAVARNGFSTVLFARLALLPNNLLNYACGLTGMRLPDFLFGTALGSLPLLVANVLIGASAVDLFSTMAQDGLEPAQPPFKLLFASIAGLALIVIVAKRLRRRVVNPAPAVESGSDEVSSQR